jgi:hypothetical protein
VRLLLLLVLVTFLATACAEETPQPTPPSKAAPPQFKELDWIERFEQDGATFVFRVRSLEVLPDGWRAEISVTNGTKVRYSVAAPDATAERVFGVMLFRSDDLREVEERSSSGELLPGIRRAQTFQPALPPVLEPDETWSGTIGAPGALAVGRWLRVVFGTFVPIGESPEGFPEELIWITDHAYQLEG